MDLAISYIEPGQETGNLAKVFSVPQAGQKRFCIERLPFPLSGKDEILVSALYTEHNQRLSVLVEHEGKDVLNAACGYTSEKVSFLFRLRNGFVINLLLGESLAGLSPKE